MTAHPFRVCLYEQTTLYVIVGSVRSVGKGGISSGTLGTNPEVDSVNHITVVAPSWSLCRPIFEHDVWQVFTCGLLSRIWSMKREVPRVSCSSDFEYMFFLGMIDMIDKIKPSFYPRLLSLLNEISLYGFSKKTFGGAQPPVVEKFVVSSDDETQINSPKK